MKVAHKLSALLLGGILLIHGASATVWILRERAQIQEDFARDEKVLGRALSLAVAEIWRVAGEEAALTYVQQASDRRDEVEIRWVWLDAVAPHPQAPVASSDALRPLAHGELVVVHHGEDLAATVYTYVPAQIPGARAGAIEIADALIDEEAFLRENVVSALVTAGLLVVLCGLLAWSLGSAFIGRPIGLLVKHARNVGTGDLGQRLSSRSRDEIGELARALNQMCDGLQQARDRVDAEVAARLATVEQLRHADRLATVGTLASGVAHELGTPINVVEGHAQLIQEDRAANEQCKEYAEVITRQCKRMAQIIRDLLKFARRSGGSGGSTDLGDVVRETLRMLEPLTHKRDVTASVVNEGAAIARIEFDQMQQVLTNIFVNAIQSMPDGGTVAVRISTERVETPGKAQDAAEYLCVRVEDSGVGMDEETKKRIFEPFFTTKDVGDGTGLGLSVAFGIVQDHGGWIDVVSESGRGSTFVIYLLPEKTT
jgi:signal transduction histidine kinase